MAETRIVKEVHPGVNSEIYTSLTPTSGDTLYIAFNGPATIDEIIFKAGSSASMTCEIDIIYPSSGFIQDIDSAVLTGSSEWSLNDGGNYAAKWYELPSGASLRINFSVTTSDKIELLLVAR